MIKQINPLTTYPITAPIGQMPVLRVSVSETDRAADIVMSLLLSSADVGDLVRIVRENFYRSVYISSQITNGRNDVDAAFKKVGAKITWVDRLPTTPSMLYRGDAKIRRGTMTNGVRSICASLAQYRTLWRHMGQTAILEKPIGADPWLRPIDVSEIEMMIDSIGVEGDETNGESGYILNRVAHAVIAGLASWLPPASSVERSDDENPPGYDRNAEAIRM